MAGRLVLALEGTGEMSAHKCPECGYTYNEAEGDPREGFAPGTLFAELPDDFTCPGCLVTFKNEFVRE